MRDVSLTLSLDRAVWIALYQLTKEKEAYWLNRLSQPRLTEGTKALYRRARERWGGAREQLDAVINRTKYRNTS